MPKHAAEQKTLIESSQDLKRAFGELFEVLFTYFVVAVPVLLRWLPIAIILIFLIRTC